MNYKIFFIISILLINSCTSINVDKTGLDKGDKQYSNRGFSITFDEKLFLNKEISKKIDNRSYLIFHRTLKKNSNVKITNLLNNKSVIAKVKSNRVNFPFFYNSVITKRISEDLELDGKEPYVSLELIVNNSSFVAKTSKMFEEEKNVAQKAPIDGIQINDLNNPDTKKKAIKNDNFSYSIKVADFYYKKTAILMLERIKNETKLNNYKIIQISKTKYRVILGPFNDIKVLKDSYNKAIKLNFENLEIIKNV